VDAADWIRQQAAALEGPAQPFDRPALTESPAFEVKISTSRPFSDTRIAELDARKRSLYSRVNRAATAGC
jgi:hypothetical protein